MIEQNPQSSAYHTLTPVSKPDELGEYENAILFALTEKDVRNIAVTGVYGSGKSSLIKSFEDKYRGDLRFNFLNVSLASFAFELNEKFVHNKLNGDVEQKAERNEKQDIEKSLLQQIIFKVKSDALEDSQFTRIRIKRYLRFCLTKLDFLTTHFWTAFFVIAMILATKFVFKPDYSLFKDSWLFDKQYSYFYELIVLIGLMGIVQLIFNWVPKLGLSKFSAGGAEISFNEKKGDSILNKHLDELIYFFAITRFNIVVFEDLDRLQSREILIKLREINQLINNSEEINEFGKNKVVKFVFALSDDLFADEIDRIKFFDFILPVIPVVNYSNSREKLEGIIKKAFPEIKFKPNFLDEVTQFLGDMRLLFNVANEFIVYKRRLDSDSSESKDKLKLDDTKLLAMIIYKNRYPDDFAKLNQRQGKVWDVLSTKDDLLEALTSKIKTDISDSREKIASAEAENTIDLNELKRSYLAVYLFKYPNLAQFEINGSRYAVDSIYNDDSLFDLLSNQNASRYIDKNNYLQSCAQFSAIEKEVRSDITYQQRKVRLQSKLDGTISLLKANLAKNEKELNNALKSSFSELINKQLDAAFAGLGKNDALIKYLMLRGLIGEDYLSYTTYFYPGELTANDQQYRIAQLSNTPLANDYKLDNLDKVFEKISEASFKNTAIFNFDMLTYTSQLKSGTRKFAGLIEAIIDANEIGYDFLNRWLNLTSLTDESKKTVLNAITKTDKSYWQRNYDLTEHSKLGIRSIAIALLQYLDSKALGEIKETDFIQHILREDVDIFNSIAILGYTKLEKLFNFFKISFSSLEHCVDDQLLEVIEKSNAYAITVDNLKKILSRGNQNQEKVVPTYTYIQEKGSQAVNKFVVTEMYWFASNVLQNLENAEESEESAVKLLENEGLENELKVSLIQKLNFKIKDIESVTDKELWAALLNSKRVEACWGNVIKYFKYAELEFDDVLLDYLNDQESVKGLTKIKLRHNIDDELALARKIVRCAELDDEIYRQLLIAIAISFRNLSDLSVSVIKIEALLSSRKVALTNENHEFLKLTAPSKSYLLIEQDFESYLEDPAEYEITNSERISLLRSSVLSVTDKSQLIALTSETDYDKELATAYSEFDVNQSKEKLFNSPLVEKLLTFDLTAELKVKLFNRYSDTFNHESILDAIDNMPEKIAGLRSKQRPKLIKSEFNLRFSNFLKNKQYISVEDYKKDPTQIQLFPKTKILK